MKTIFVSEMTTIPGTLPPETFMFDLARTPVTQCCGCWSCWWRTPGRCIHKELDRFYHEYVTADRVIFLARTVRGFVTGDMKSLFDRMIPLFLPYTTYQTGESMHVKRYEKYPDIEFIYSDEGMSEEEREILADYVRRVFYQFLFAADSRATDEGIRDISGGGLMSTVLINASPKGSGTTCNSEILAQAFRGGMRYPCDLRHLAGSDLETFAQETRSYDVILFILPLYIHAMPGLMMRFLSILPEACDGQSIGFIVQAGFIETEQEKFVVRYFEAYARRMGYQYLGTVTKGEAAGIYMFPKMFRKVLEAFSQLGRAFEETGAFDRGLVTKLGAPYCLSKGQLLLLRAVTRIGLNDIGWHRMQKQNGAYERRLDRPYL